jgi:hypothetical protein
MSVWEALQKAPPSCMAEAGFSTGGEAPALVGFGPSDKALRLGSPPRWSAFFTSEFGTKRRARRRIQRDQGLSDCARSASRASEKNPATPAIYWAGATAKRLALTVRASVQRVGLSPSAIARQKAHKARDRPAQQLKLEFSARTKCH